MAGRVEMFRRVLVLRAVAAPDISADEAHPQIDPCVAELYAFFADRDVFRMDITDLVEMGAGFFGCHGFIVSKKKARRTKVRVRRA